MEIHNLPIQNVVDEQFEQPNHFFLSLEVGNTITQRIKQ